MKIKHIKAINDTVERFYKILDGITEYKQALKVFNEYGSDIKITYSSDECFDVDVGLMAFTIDRVENGGYKIHKYATYYNWEVSEPIEL